MSTRKSTEAFGFTARLIEVTDIIKNKISLNQKQIAEIIGLKPAALSKLLIGGSKTASDQTLLLLKDKLGVNPVWLTDNQGAPFLDDQKMYDFASTGKKRTNKGPTKEWIKPDGLKYHIDIEPGRLAWVADAIRLTYGIEREEIAVSINTTPKTFIDIAEDRESQFSEGEPYDLLEEKWGVRKEWLKEELGFPFVEEQELFEQDDLSKLAFRLDYLVSYMQDTYGREPLLFWETLRLDFIHRLCLQNGTSEKLPPESLEILDRMYCVRKSWVMTGKGDPFHKKLDPVIRFDDNGIIIDEDDEHQFVIATKEGWSRILEYARSREARVFKKFTAELAYNARDEDVQRRLLVSPLLCNDSYGGGNLREAMVFYTEGSPPKNFLIFDANQSNKLYNKNYDDKIVYRCKSVLDLGFFPFKKFERACKFYLELTKEENEECLNLLEEHRAKNENLKTSGKTEIVGVLQDQIKGLETDKDRQNKLIDRLYDEIDDLKAELSNSENGNNSA
jgi:transcriptional regulator with XRE-family HTH domain